MTAHSFLFSRHWKRLAAHLVLAAIFLLAYPSTAKVVTVSPSSNHPALTMTTDESRGFQVVPGKPLKLEIVGPGNLNLTVRLNQKGKQPAIQGQLEIHRADKVIKKADLNLHRSRVGAYKEDANLSPSLPKVFKLAVPAGRQTYLFVLKAGKGVSMTVSYSYDTEAEQTVAKADIDSMELVPLVAPGGESEKPAVAAGGTADDLPLVPLVSTTPEEPPKAAKPAAKPEKPETKPEAKPAEATTKVAAASTKPAETTPAARPEVKPVAKVENKPIEKPPETKPPQERVASTTTPVVGETNKPAATSGAAETPTIQTAAPSKKLPVVSLGLLVGQISPFQVVGGTTFTGALDVRYVLPVNEGRLTVGVEGGFYQYQITYTNLNAKYKTTVIPVSANVFYRIPLKIFVEPFVGLGGDLFIAMASKEPSSGSGQSASGSGLAFGGHLSIGLEAKLGPGYVLIEARGGISSASIQGIWENINLSGISTVAGYRFVF